MSDFDLTTVLHNGAELAGSTHLHDLDATVAILRWAETPGFKTWLEQFWQLEPYAGDGKRALAALIRYRSSGRIR